MEKIELAELNKAIDKIKAEVTEKGKKLRACNVKMATLTKEAKIITEQIRSKELRLQLLREHAVLVNGVSKDVLSIRGMLIKLRAQLQRKDITIACKEELDASIKKLEKDLVATCKHEFLVGYSGHSGSQYNDRTDSYHGRRLCVVCGYFEYAKRGDGHDKWGKLREIFPCLNDNPDRLVISCDDFKPYQSHGRQTFEIWRPLEELLEIFVDNRVYKIMKEREK